MTRPNNVTTDYTYDNLSRLLSVLHKLSGNTIDGASYTVDAVGNRTAKANLLPSGPVENYTYDAIYQLTQVVQNGSATTESYTYDPAGNRLSSLAASPWNYNVSNQLTSIAGSPGTTFTYDSNGNTLTKTDSSGTTTYAWDFENRLTSVTLPGSGGTVSFKYDPLGRRVYKGSSTGTTIFVHDGDNLIEEVDAAGSPVARYAMGLIIDEPLAMLRSGATHFYEADGLGSVTSLSDLSGSLASSYTYDSFGNLSSTGSLVNPFRFTAREWDSDSGLYSYRARYFDKGIGRFTSEDPIGFDGGPNFYVYAQNNSPNLDDPFGLFALDTSCGCGWDKDALKRADELARGAVDRILEKGIRECIRKKLEKGKVKCGSKKCDKGAKPDKEQRVLFGHSIPFGKTITVCKPAFSSDAQLACTIIHEFAHTCKAREGRADRVSKQAFPECY